MYVTRVAEPVSASATVSDAGRVGLERGALLARRSRARARGAACRTQEERESAVQRVHVAGHVNRRGDAAGPDAQDEAERDHADVDERDLLQLEGVEEVLGEVGRRDEREAAGRAGSRARARHDEGAGRGAREGLGDDAARDGAEALHRVDPVGLDVDEVVDGVDGAGEQAEDPGRGERAAGEEQVERRVAARGERDDVLREEHRRQHEEVLHPLVRAHRLDSPASTLWRSSSGSLAGPPGRSEDGTRATSGVSGVTSFRGVGSLARGGFSGDGTDMILRGRDYDVLERSAKELHSPKAAGDAARAGAAVKLRGPVAALALAVLAASCRPRAPEMRDAGSDAHPAEAASRAPLRPGARPDAGARAAAPGSPTPDWDAGTTFLHALARGRAATTRKDFPAALAAFDEALGKVPREPRALAERGYAKLLAGDVYGAGMDLRAARGRTTDEALSAQIRWNLGLWGEKAGNAAFAHEAFAHAYALRPSRAGRAKLGDAGTCAATLDRERVKLEHHATWPTGWEDVRATCGAACLTTAKPVDAGDDPEHDAAGDVPHHLVIPAPGGGYDVIEAISSGPPSRSPAERGSCRRRSSTSGTRSRCRSRASATWLPSSSTWSTTRARRR